MAAENGNTGVYVSFSNHNYAFNYFYDTYKKLCIEVSETKNIKTVKKKIYAFISEFSYAIPSEEDKIYYIKQLLLIKDELNKDVRINQLLFKAELSTQEEIEYLKLYYNHFKRYLVLLSEFSENLTSTLMPNLNMQKKLLRYSNNEPFFEKFTTYKRLIIENLSEFRITAFRKPINLFITYYFAYKLFINESSRIFIEESISLILNKLLHKSTLDCLSRKDRLLPEEKRYLISTESQVHELIMKCNVKMNDSFCDFDILPKINKRVNSDRQLI